MAATASTSNMSVHVAIFSALRRRTHLQNSKLASKLAASLLYIHEVSRLALLWLKQNRRIRMRGRGRGRL